MPVSASDFVSQAECLKNSDLEIDWRTSISRSYYAVYHQAVELARGQGFKATPPSVHGQLFGFLEEKHPTKTSIVRRMRIMRKNRNNADYEMNETISKHNAYQQFVECKLLINSLNGF